MLLPRRVSTAENHQPAAAAVVTPVRAPLSAHLDDLEDMYSPASQLSCNQSGNRHRLQDPHPAGLSHSHSHCNGQSQSYAQSKVVVLAATNRLEDLDEAVLRRFETKVYVGLPDLPARLHMLALHLRGIDCTLSQQDLDAVGSMTAGWSGSDIEVQYLCSACNLLPNNTSQFC